MPLDVLWQPSVSMPDLFVSTLSAPASIAARIAAHAANTPTQVAVSDESTSLTFADLDHKSNQLAWELREAGIAAERCVGLYFDRSTDFVVAALAVMKSGGAYLPLDSATPADRAATMLRDAAAPIVLSHRGKTRDWAAAEWHVIEIDGLQSAPTLPPPPAYDPENLAYVVYTSGSTGKPKGVEITHANLLNLVNWHNGAFKVTAADRAGQVAGLGFDATAWEVWPHLAAGASVHIADEATRRSPHALRDWLVAQRISISFVPTLLAEQLMHTDWPADTALRTLLTGADVLHRRPVAGLPFVVVNNYGPSECTVVSTSGIVAANADIDGPPSIGRPIAGATVLLLDEHLQPVKAGEAGELCVGGALVGRGYRNLPEMTASKFVTVTYPGGPSLRIYRTGDRARLLPNGEIAFLGRLDDQMKIRGYRIEPGEIVSHLERFLGIDAAAVAAVNGEAGPTLTAYIVASEKVRLTDVDLRQYLSSRLPDYMIPAQFVKLDALPTTANGKLDKAALPAPTADNVLAASNIPTPATTGAAESLEDKLAALVASLLDVPSVAHTDNFFLLGGHSMLAAQLVARVGDVFGVQLTLRQLFGSPTVAALSTHIARLQGKVNA